MVQALLDWDLIRREYIQGFVVVDPETNNRRVVYPKYEELALKFNCHPGTIAAKAAEEKPSWREQRSHLKAKLAEREDGRRINYYLSESATLDAEVLSLVRDHFTLVRMYLDDLLPIAREADTIISDTGIVKPEAIARQKVELKELEASSRILKTLQEVGRRAISEPVGGIREFLVEAKKENSTDANALRVQVETLQNRLKHREKQKQKLVKNKT